VKYVLMYESGDGVAEKAPQYFPEHQAWFLEFHKRGTLLMVGPFVDPREGAMSVFTTREAAEEFAAGDPFVLNGLIRSWRIYEWNEVLFAT
jgi:uncharacterized protein YciI